MKFPALPLRSRSFALVIISMFGDRPASTSFGASIHMEQSLVGNVLSSCAITPPIEAFFSTRYT